MECTSLKHSLQNCLRGEHCYDVSVQLFHEQVQNPVQNNCSSSSYTSKSDFYWRRGSPKCIGKCFPAIKRKPNGEVSKKSFSSNIVLKFRWCNVIWKMLMNFYGFFTGQRLHTRSTARNSVAPLPNMLSLMVDVQRLPSTNCQNRRWEDL